MTRALSVDELKGKFVGMCVSGGLDSKTITKRLMEAGVNVTCFCADLGQPDEPEIENVAKKMEPCGAPTILVDLKDEIAAECFEVIKASASYDGGYWNSTGIGRAVTARGLIQEMKKRGVRVLAHGATGRGNDQVRFERYTRSLAPDMDVYAPWRDPILLAEFPGRTEMAAYLNQHGIPAVVGMKKKYSTDANLAGLSHEAEDLESLETPCLIVETTMGVWPEQAEPRIETVTLRYASGACTEINGKPVSPLRAMQLANDIGGRNGIGIRSALENRIIGTKGRGVYEAPGMELLNFGLRQILQATLDRRGAKLYNQLGSFLADQLYDGRWFDTTTRAAQASIDHLTRRASGLVSLGLYRGNIFFQSMTELESSLYNPQDSSMEASDSFDPQSSQGYVEIISVEAHALAAARQIEPERD